MCCFILLSLNLCMNLDYIDLIVEYILHIFGLLFGCCLPKQNPNGERKMAKSDTKWTMNREMTIKGTEESGRRRERESIGSALENLWKSILLRKSNNFGWKLICYVCMTFAQRRFEWNGMSQASVCGASVQSNSINFSCMCVCISVYLIFGQCKCLHKRAPNTKSFGNSSKWAMANSSIIDGHYNQPGDLLCVCVCMCACIITKRHKQSTWIHVSLYCWYNQ